MKRLLSFFAFKRLDGMIRILACPSAQLGFWTFPSGYFRTFPLDTTPEFPP